MSLFTVLLKRILKNLLILYLEGRLHKIGLDTHTHTHTHTPKGGQ